ncbi:MAG: 5'-nucleotidase C-terminal domain-containing protein [Peptostreptococcaceae bacterium]|nr:5'-nucleotidase C-terminal domain-containing protein [Peptostreptococcaceae bacterium]
MKRSISKLIAAVMLTTTIFSSSAFAAEEKMLTIIHTNDVHAAVVDNGKSQIGFAKLGTYVEELRKKDEILVLDAGDMIQGLPIANLEKGKSIIPMANEIGYDAMAVGNHEFDFGTNVLFEIEKGFNFPMLANNVMKGGKSVFKPYIVKEVKGLKVGIFGIATPETAFKTHPENVVGYEFSDMIKASKDSVDKLRNTEKVDIVIALAHLGLYEGEYTSDLIAKNVEGIDLIIDGHSHTMLDKGLEENGTLIVSTGSSMRAVGKVDLKIVDKKVVGRTASLLKYDDMKDVKPEQAILDAIKKVEEKQSVILDKVVGKTAVDLVGERNVVRTGESNLGQLATAAMLDLTKADMAITNGGGIRASIKAGDITMRDLVTVFPFGNTVMVKEVKGSDIVAALEHGTNEYPNEKGAFPHVGGITFTLRVNASVGKRVTDVKIGGQAIDMEKTYKVATNDFMAAGGDGYLMFKPYPSKAEYNTLMDTLLDYVQKVGKVEGKMETKITFDKGSGGDEKVGIREFAQSKGYKVNYDAKAKSITILQDGKAVMTIDVKSNSYVKGEQKGSIGSAPILENGRYLYMTKDLNRIFSPKAA